MKRLFRVYDCVVAGLLYAIVLVGGAAVLVGTVFLLVDFLHRFGCDVH